MMARGLKLTPERVIRPLPPPPVRLAKLTFAAFADESKVDGDS